MGGGRAEKTGKKKSWILKLDKARGRKKVGGEMRGSMGTFGQDVARENKKRGMGYGKLGSGKNERGTGATWGETRSTRMRNEGNIGVGARPFRKGKGRCFARHKKKRDSIGAASRKRESIPEMS